MRMWERSIAGAAILAMAACASAATGDEDGTPTAPLTVTVENNGTFPGTLRITLVPQAGQEILLGRTSTLGSDVVRGRVPSTLLGSFRLRATGTGRRALVSQPLQLRAGDHVHWDLRRNAVRAADP
jgi:hypothetical protein